jgi:hypothetical protein
MNVLYLSARALHVLLGATWLGFVTLMSFFLMPAVVEAGPDGGKIMAGMARRGLSRFIASIAGLTVLTGLVLFWLTGRFGAASATIGGRLLGVGALLGLIAAIVGGGVVGRGMDRAMKLAGEAAATSDAKLRAQLLADAGQARDRAAKAAKVVVVLLMLTTVLMAIGPHM